MRLVAGDVGGTKTLLALYERREGDEGALVEVASRRFESAAYPSLEAVLRAFLGELSAADSSHSAAPGSRHDGPLVVDAACFGVAGPVQRDVCEATNLPWRIDARALERELGLSRARLVNDFEAVALGLGELPDAAFAVLQPRPVDPRGVVAVLGAGTGLGEAIVLPAASPAGLPRVIPTEGGHTDFAPRDETEIALLRFLLERHAHVSYERVLSGPGLVALRDFVVSCGLAPGSPELESKLARAEDRGATIGEAALARSDEASTLAARMFASIYGAEAGNLALKTLPRGGLVVAGGIAPKLLELLREGEFLRAFRAKGRMGRVLDAIDVRVVLEPRVGLYGARRVACALAAGMEDAGLA